MRRLIPVILLVAMAGCGSSSGDDQASSPPASATSTTVAAPKPRPKPKPKPKPANPCAPRAEAKLAAAVGASSAAVGGSRFTPPSRAAGCRLAAGDVTAEVLLDRAPQAYVRMEREAVEYTQNTNWTGKPPSAFPATVGGIGLDAYWFPLQSRLLTTDGVRLVTIIVHGLDPRARKRLAVRLAPVYLGPLRKPPGY